jgi:DNA-directed RNA polymerase subunit H (RpoH/RPB5)
MIRFPGENTKSVIERSRQTNDYLGTMIERLYRVKRTTIEMLDSRNFVIPADEKRMFIEEEPELDENYTDNYRQALGNFAEYYYGIAIATGESFHQALYSVYVENVQSISYQNRVYNYQRELEEYSRTDKIQDGKQPPVQPSLKNIAVYFLEPQFDETFKNTGVEPISAVQRVMTVNKIWSSIAISISGFTPAAVKSAKGQLRLELFTYNDLNQNITKHFLQPDFELLTIQKRNELLTRSNLKLLQLPRMSFEDPASKFYGALPGDVFRLIRRVNVGTQISYRAVMPTPLVVESGDLVQDVNLVYG